MSVQALREKYLDKSSGLFNVIVMFVRGKRYYILPALTLDGIVAVQTMITVLSLHHPSMNSPFRLYRVGRFLFSIFLSFMFKSMKAAITSRTE